MAQTGTFGGFDFDVEVFGDYMAEQNTIDTSIEASGIIKDDPSIMGLIGEKGNVATIPFYTELDATADKPLNNDGKTDNTPTEVTGNKQTTMLIQRMKAWKAQDFTKELTGANPMQHIANQVTHYYQQVWQNVLMTITDAALSTTDLKKHIYDITKVGDGKVTPESLIYAQEAAFGDHAMSGGLLIMHSTVFAKYQAANLVEFEKYTTPGALSQASPLARIGGMVVIVNNAFTTASVTDASINGGKATTAYKTYVLGEGSFVGCRKTNYEKPYYTDYDPESKAGIQKLYTKEGRVIHPNGMSFKVDNVAEASPNDTELGAKANWERRMKLENIRIGQMLSLG